MIQTLPRKLKDVLIDANQITFQINSDLEYQYYKLSILNDIFDYLNDNNIYQEPTELIKLQEMVSNCRDQLSIINKIIIDLQSDKGKEHKIIDCNINKNKQL